MEPLRSLPALRDRLQAEGRDDLLVMRLDDVADRLSSAPLGTLLGRLGRDLGHQTLGGLLADPRADRQLEAGLPRGSYLRAFEILGQWAVEPGGLRTRWTPRPEVPPDAPRATAEVVRWANRAGVPEALLAPVRWLAPFLSERLAFLVTDMSGPATVGEYLGSRNLPATITPRSVAAGELADAARAYVVYRAARLRRQEEREARWSRAPDERRLRLLASRLAHSLARVARSPDAGMPVLLGGRPVHVTLDPPELWLDIDPEGRPARRSPARLSLLGFEHEPPALACGCMDGPADCAHVRVLLEYTLDAIHDATHPLRPAIEAAIRDATWERLVGAIEDAAQAEQGAAGPTVERVAFRVARDDAGRLSVDAVVQKQGKSGRFSRGATREPDKLLAQRSLLDPTDEPPLRHLAEGRHGEALLALVGHPRVYDAADPTLRLRVERGRTSVLVEPAPGGVRLSASFGESPIAAADLARGVVLDWSHGQRTCVVAPVDPRLREVARASLRYPVVVPDEGVDRLLASLARLQPEVDLELPAALRGRRIEEAATVVLRLEPLEPEGLRARVLVQPLAGGATWEPGIGPETALGVSGQTRAHAVRDLEAEREAAKAMVRDLGLGEARREAAWTFALEGLEPSLELLEKASELGERLVVEWPNDKRRPRLVGRASSAGLTVRVRSARRWLAVEGTVDVGGQAVALEELLRAVRERRRFVRVGPRSFARLEKELVARLEGAADVVFAQGGELTAATAHAAALEALAGDRLDADAGYLALRARMRKAETFEADPPTDLRAQLRDYQVEGFRWLARLAAWDAGACLADEMGLGKTLQALALLTHRRDEGPALVIAPTSVIPVWLAEAARFAPSLTPRLHHGPRRARALSELGPGDVLVTSYDVATRDAGALSAVRFGTAVLDEAQALKNPRAKRSVAIRSLDAGFRLALTGTPVENSLSELWSIFDALVPGLLGTLAHFRAVWAVPIERHGDQERRQALAERVRPFLLRRTKAQVAPELPPRTEVVHPVEPNDAERALYEAARREALEALGEVDGKKRNKGQERFAVLAALTRLRLLSCHPRLLDPASTVASSKLEAFLELVRALLSEGHRALVFSQFTSHLALVREALDAHGIEHLYLDGGTPARDRGELVQRFQGGEGELFLISLKAGGTGLNLTGADYVLHLDPWWNPAVEDQATDRAHRIGQDKPVTVVRLVSQGTIEEKVVELHERKRELADQILEGSDAVAQLDAEELLALVRE